MKAMVLSSGGVDSTTALGLAVSKYGKENVIALSQSLMDRSMIRKSRQQLMYLSTTVWSTYS